jgi:hypothetical protein
MMRMIGTALLLLGSAIVAGQDAKPSTMFPDGRSHDFGAVQSGSIVKHSFRIVNTSDVPLQFDVRTSAGCVKGVMTKRPIPPNQQETLEISVDTRRFRGAKEMRVFIHSQGGAVFRFTIKAETALED